MGTMKTLTINGATYNIVPVVPASSVTLLATEWVSEAGTHHQVVNIPGVTAHSKVDLQPTAEQLAEFHHKILGFVAENDGGVVTVYAIGDRPTNDHVMQVTFKDVDATGKIRGNTVGTTNPRANLSQTNSDMADYVFGKDEFMDEVMNNVEDLLEERMPSNEVTERVASADDYSITGFCRPAGTFGTQNGYRRTDYIAIDSYETLTIRCQPNSDSVSPVVWFDSAQNYISGVTAESKEEYQFTVEVPEGAVYAVFSSDSGNMSRSVYGTRMEASTSGGSGVTKCYISPIGNDSNDGQTTNAAVKTLGRAKELLSPDGELIFLEGVYENLDYDLSLFSKVSTVGDVRLVYYAEKIMNVTKVSGYERIYSAPYTGSYSDDIWQFGVPDANTEILEEERHPLQRGRSHRLEHTRLYPVELFYMGVELADHLDFMEASDDKYTFFLHEGNCYFTVPNTDFVTYPVIVPSNVTLKASERKNVHISGLKIYFASVLTTNLSGVLENLTVGYHNKNGAIMWDNTFGLTLNNCEVAASANDGINGHDAGDITCYNCWGHDCADDGESCHETCHIIQYGGLYEYNGNGCTPASGASGEYINTICRSNKEFDWVSDLAGTGFSAQNTSTTAPALMYCIGCYTSDCNVGFRQHSSSKATFVNCVSKNDVKAFGAGTQINCAAFDDEHPKYETEEWVFELEDGTTATKQVVVK